MEMDMEDGLPGAPVHVEHGPPARFGVPFRGCNGLRRAEHVADQRFVGGIELVQAGDVLLRDDQHVRRCLRVEVPDCEDLVVRIDRLRRDLAIADLAEQALAHRGGAYTWSLVGTLPLNWGL